MPTIIAAADPRLTSLSVVLPCFDEVENVAAAVAQAHTAAEAHALRHEVVVVDDGSSDGTDTVAAALAGADPRVRVVTHEVNRGYGAAVRSGFAATRAEWVLLTDGDLQFDLSELGDLVALAPDHDLVAGYRIDRADPAGRRAAARAWNALVRRSFGVAVRDVDCAFKLVRGDRLRALPLTSDGAMISTELVVLAQRSGWRIAEVGVHHRPRTAGVPSGGDPTVVLRAFREHRALQRALREAERPAAQRGLGERAPAT
jgi:glycosyltransferase involved in cell wall biosynthesis